MESVQRVPISLAIITLNEEKYIDRCIRSVPWAEDIVVLDSESTDRTREIASELGARVFNEPFRGFRKQKERAAELTKNDWVLFLDADEALSSALANEIQGLFVSGDINTYDGFEIKRVNLHLGRWIAHGGWHPDAWVRLFNKNKATWKGGHVHERVDVENRKRLRTPIFHRVFEDLSEQVITNNKYSTLGSQDLREKGKRFSLAKLLLKPISKFLETYILKRGFLDGLPGFIISVGASYSIFLKFAKLWEIEKLESKEKDSLYREIESKVEAKL